MILEVNNLSVQYGEIKAVKNINFHINESEIVTIIGSNGAGKTTTLETIAGLLKPIAGKIIYEDIDITNLDSSQIVNLGLSLSPEERRVFPDMSVYENLELGAIKRGKREFQDTLQLVYDMFPILEERKNQPAGLLSGGEQQMLSIARSLMSKPKLLMLDEPSLGLAPIYVSKIFEVFESIRESETAILLVEQNARKALSISDRAYILDTGIIKYEGSSEHLLDDDEIISIYFGDNLDS